jgi:uncharacterized membrane protein YoaK (UPF0700 family)
MGGIFLYMPISYLRALTIAQRNQKSNSHLAGYLAFVAGAANAGGFLAVKQYTSHMSGIVSAMADNLALGDLGLLSAGFGALFSFMGGAACSAILINWARRHRLRSQYAVPLLLEAALLVCFGMMGANLERHKWLSVPLTVCVLCFVMGLQNAMVTKISRAEIRTTHVTGMVTDIGIELGKLFYWNASHRYLGESRVLANRSKLKLLGVLVSLFFAGGIVGAFGFKHIGFSSALALAAILIMVAIVPVTDDIWIRLRRLSR